ncbi:MAG: TPM domain-containing protein [Chthoniobacterales bacterium]
MRCPSCLTVLQGAVEACPDCGFTLATLDKKFGTVPKNFRSLTDYSGLYTGSEQNLLEKKLIEAERFFPGLYLSVMSMEVHPSFKPREYLFWLVNRCHFSPMETRMERNFSVVLFFDSASRTVLLTTGYGLEKALPEDKLQVILNAALPDFHHEHFYRGTIGILQEVRRHLKIYCSTGYPAEAPELKTAVQLGHEAKTQEDLF